MRPLLVLMVISIVLWLAGVALITNAAPDLGRDVCTVGGVGFGVFGGLLLYKKLKDWKKLKK